MSKISKCIIVVMTLILAFNQSIYVLAQDNNTNLLMPYVIKLQELNSQLGTNYEFISEETLTKNDVNTDSMITYFTSMNMEQFEDYIISLYDLSESINNLEEATSSTITNSEELPSAVSPSSVITSTRQRYYYSGSNSLRIDANIHSIGSLYVYDNIINYGSTHPNYPYLDPSLGFSHSFSTNKSQVYCTFYCVKYLSEYITDGVYYTINVTFTAGGGDIYPIS